MRLTLTLLVGLFLFTSSLFAKTFDLVCPPDYYLNCGDDISNLSVFGEAYYWENYVKYSAGLAHVEYHLTSCQTGYITREWTVEDQYWKIYKCTQTIYISGGNFKASDITWPEDDLHLYGCDADIDPNSLPDEFQEPSWNYVTCSHVASSFRDQVFNFGQDCRKILRHWTVIDWCSYTGGGTTGYFTHTQTIKISKNEPPLISCPKDVVINATPRCDSSYVSIIGAAIEGESCTGTYSVTHDSPFGISSSSASGVYPIGTTIVNFSVEYACGKNVSCQTKVKVNTPGPVPYCLSDINVALMPLDTDFDGIVDDGMVEIWAKDVNVGSYHPCNNRPLQFSFSSDVTDMFRVFTCEDVGYNTVQMWVTDHTGKQSYCLVNVHVQNNAANIPDCEPDIGVKYVLAGTIFTEEEEPLRDVIITAKDREPIYKYVEGVVEKIEYTVLDSFYSQSGALLYTYSTDVVLDTVIVDSIQTPNIHYLYTDENGVYGSNEILTGREYEVTAYKEGEMKDIGDEDLGILGGHVFGRSFFTNPYTYLAADINEDNVINEKDYYILQDLVKEDEDEWPNERQWVFFSKEDMKEMSDNPLEDEMSKMQKMTDMTPFGNTASFVGILKGDLTRFEEFQMPIKNAQTERVTEKEGNETHVYPNPFSNELSITNNTQSNLEIEIYSLDGKKVLSFNSNNKLINVPSANELESGTFLYRITKEGLDIQTGKLVKN